MADHTLDALFTHVGVASTPTWFRQIKLPNWPFPHQMQVLQKYARNTRFGDFSEPGVGKTYPAQAHAVLMAALQQAAGTNEKVFFAMPPKLIRQFYHEFHDFFVGIEKHIYIDHLDCSAMQKKKRIETWSADDGWPNILIGSYEMFRRFGSKRLMVTVPSNQIITREDGSRWTKDGREVNQRNKAKNLHQDGLYGAGYRIFFFDEAHALCNPESIVFKTIERMDCDHHRDIAIYPMTGTPVPTHLENIYGLIKLLNREVYTNKAQFDRRHVILDPGSTFRSVLGYKNIEPLNDYLYARAIRVQKRDVYKDMPEPLCSTIPVRLSGIHKKLYDSVLGERFAVLGDRVLSPENDSALRMLSLQLISCPEEFDPEGINGKIAQDNELAQSLDALLESIDPSKRKVLVFSHFKSTIKALARRYAHFNPAVLNGASTQGHKEVDRFKNDDSCRIFFLNWISGGAGLNLQANCSHIVFYECPTSPKDAKQAIGRVDRHGQKEQVNAYFFRVMGTYADRNYKNLLKNEQQNNEAVRDRHDLLYQQLKVGKKVA